MHSVEIYRSKHYTVQSYGNGTCYLTQRRNDKAELFVQGDDATEFHDRVFEGSRDFDTAIDDYGDIFEMPKDKWQSSSPWKNFPWLDAE